MNKHFWINRSVAITGHTGFKGSWLSFWLSSIGAKVHGYSLDPETSPNLFNVLNLKDKISSSTIGDIRDPDALKVFLKNTNPEIVIHMAAQPLVREGYSDPIKTYSTNVMGTVCLFEAIRTTNTVRAVVNVTTDKCYQNNEWVWAYRENDILGGYDPYSNSKACSELVTSAYRDSFFSLDEYGSKHSTLIASVRAGNVIGGGDWAKDRLIPDIVTNFQKNKKVVLRNPNAIRPWQHVLEPLRGYLMLCERLYNGEKNFATSWNFAPRDEDTKTVKWIVEHLARVIPSSPGYEIDISKQPHEANLLKLDFSKAKNLLRWEPSLRIEQTLDHIGSWYTSHQNSMDMSDETLKFIKEYEKINGIQ